MKALEVSAFGDVFVKSQSLRYSASSMPWISVPTKNGTGLLTVLSYDDGLALYGAFLLLARAAANMEARGRFERHGVALSNPEIARLAMVPVDKIDDYVARLSDVGWLIRSEAIPEMFPEVTSEPTSERGSERSSEVHSERQDRTGQDGSRERKSSSGEKKKGSAKFVEPEIDEVNAYAQKLGHADFDGTMFCAHYAARGWRYNGNVPMKNWKAAVVTWLRRKNERGE